MRVLGFMDMRRDPDRRLDELSGRYEQGEESCISPGAKLGSAKPANKVTPVF